MIKILELGNNKRKTRVYKFFGKYECGIVLDKFGLKNILGHRFSLNNSYGWYKDKELFIKNLKILDQLTTYKLLLKKEEIKKIISLIKEKNYLLLPKSIYLKNHFIKLEIGLCKYDKNHTKNEKLITLKEKNWKNFKINKFY